MARPIPWIGRRIQLFMGWKVGARSFSTWTRFQLARLKKTCIIAQTAGSRSKGSANRRESRKKRTRVSQIALLPKVKVNSVMKVEIKRVTKRIANAGPISLMILIMGLLNLNINISGRGHFFSPPFYWAKNTPGRFF